jgi:hypothetical protein
MSEKLARELERVRGRGMSATEVDAQRISFVYGNAPSDDLGTKETVRRALEVVEAHA